ncbi:MAG: hypothetical protein A2V88_16135 [Elusimicrobia bacterium RBG_16_66_12]|nr:MAG: hypothetical protein A2V88_16135 [Elusimicrobia bacterium RBG_16_66_12]
MHVPLGTVVPYFASVRAGTAAITRTAAAPATASWPSAAAASAPRTSIADTTWARCPWGRYRYSPSGMAAYISSG